VRRLSLQCATARNRPDLKNVRWRHQQMWTILPWISAAAISVLALKYFSIAYLWIFLLWSVVLFFTAAIDRVRRPLWFNMGCLLIGLAMLEYYFWTTRPEASREDRVNAGTYAERIYVPHEELGWAPRPGTAVSQSAFYQGEVLYEVNYTIGPNGLRVSSPSPGHDPSPGSECIPFFGCSFMFGQGLEDQQTLPFQVDVKSDHRYRTFNFGVMGYGAHQMLSALQYGLVDDAMSCDPTRVSHVLYEAISDHVRRAAGRVWWNTRGPRYRLTRDGEVRLDGGFEDDRSGEKTFSRLLSNQLMKSMIYDAVIQGKYVHKYDQETIDLYLGIVDEARDLVRSRYPCAAFHVLLWDEDDVDSRAIRDGLRQLGIDVHLMSEILPNYRTDELNEAYRLHPVDVHPNALANDRIADYVVREILPQPGPCDFSRTS
jgi:hypothetical protein